MFHKYHAKKTEVGGVVFDSKKEAKRYEELSAQEKAGTIKNLTLQPRFLLQEGFRYDGKAVRQIEYVSDFQYDLAIGGKTIVEDVKGIQTDVYKIKKKLFLKKYPEYEFREV